ncbi:DUF6318 family protein [Nocardioides sp. QY071]|uniref:DUF6318 family protein n=1 Tax=Nocardioides sp. QY071 TaxID=3044187 RepID=UPI00249B9095|nr:DUF6318 family protein [Nocardioides sp. QY071]WGX99860.1 DUF6318 family protein [Nocardioides sp. QY071]
MGTTLRAAAAAAAAVLLLVAGCSDDGPSPRDPTSTWSPTGKMETPTSAAPDPVEPDLPAAAAEASEAGARAFIGYYWELINYAQATGDVKALRSVSASTCEGCMAGIRGIEKHYKAGGSIVGGTNRIAHLNLTEVTSASGIYAFQGDARVDHDAQTIVAGDGTQDPRTSGSDKWNLYALWADNSHWRLDVMELK